jgi:hypothetical protein
MASGATTSPFRGILEQRLSDLSQEVEKLFGESRERARRELSDHLNQAARRLLQAGDAAGIAAALVDAACPFAAGTALFRIENQAARCEKVAPAVPPPADIPLADAPALSAAVESREPVVCAAAPAEVSAAVLDMVGQVPDGRIAIYPVIVRDRVGALLCAWGGVLGSAIELLCQMAASAWSALPEPAPDLVRIAPAEDAPQTPASAWDRLSAEEQRVHLRAQRFARVQVAEMRLFHSEAVQAGRARRDLYQELSKPIDGARAAFRQSFFTACPTMVDYLHLELVRTLAHDDPELLGKDYPGPLV